MLRRLHRSAERIRGGLRWRRDHWRDRVLRLRWILPRLVDAFHASDANPAVTLVVVGRNDNYGGQFRGRLRTTLDWNLSHHQVVECLYVEWNPIDGKPSDTEWLVRRYPKLTAFIVSRERHANICSNAKMPMMEYFAKNVGIRRAHQPWIAIVNADTLLGPDMLLRMRRLRRGRVYGSHSVNIRWSGESLGAHEMVARHRLIGSFGAEASLFSVSGNFLLAERRLWHSTRGYDEGLRDRRLSCDGHGVAQMLYLGARPAVLGSHYHLDHPDSARNVRCEHQGEYFDPWQGIPYSNSDE